MTPPRFGNAAVTIQDVAARAGVSKKTVSRVINGESHVTQATLRKVQDAIAELGYVPNVSARRLASKRSHVLALVYPVEEPPGWLTHVMQGILQTAAPRGYELVIHPCEPGEEAARRSLQTLVGRGGADGLILLPPFGGKTPFNLALHESGLPIASIEPSDPDLPWPAATITNFQGARDMTDYLLSLGHTRIGFVLGAADYRGTWDRFEGFKAALAEANVAFPEDLLASGDYHFESGLAAGRALLSKRPRPTAIFASNDEMAAGVMQAAGEQGLRIPDDLSVAGFDDSALACRLSPPLTTIRQPTADLAARVTEALIARINSEEAPSGRIEMETTLIIRASTAWGLAPEPQPPRSRKR
ncbi:MAG: LacI family DNA-binding transcriptional regulator [Candidatus Hydrogenedentes bacterium]|nr:LacI family DNA-binding transcriptional regulator [Candidatus Hydrogenedentota bacterium]